MKENPRIVGIIPARKGSKRIPRKNVTLLNGKPLIVHTFEVAKKSKLLTDLIVSTNDPEVIELANKWNIDVPFIRPDDFATDTATDFDWIQHAVDEFKKQGKEIDYTVTLRPTQPFRKAEDIDRAIKTAIDGEFDSVRSLTKVNEHPHWMKVIKDNLVKPFIDTGKPDETLRSQDLPIIYTVNGVVDVVKTNNLKSGSLYGDKMGHILIDKSVDIDYQEDLDYAEFLLKSEEQSSSAQKGQKSLLEKEINSKVKDIELQSKNIEKKKIVLVGARIDAYGGAMLDIIQQFSLHKIIGFVDDSPELKGKRIKDIPVLGTIKEFLANIPEGVEGFFVSSGNNKFREQCFEYFKDSKLSPVNIIHPSAIIPPSSKIGKGVCIGPGVIINNNVSIGDGILINSGATIDHDNIIEDFANISPGTNTSGRTTILRGAFLGTGVKTITDVVIGEYSIVGAGAVIIRDVEPNSTVVGVPAKKINN